MFKLRSVLLTLLLILGCSLLFGMGIAAEGTETLPSLGESVSYTVSPEGIITVSGEGAIRDFSAGAAPLPSLQTPILGIVITEGITDIGSHSFLNVSATHVTLPHSITSIADYAFGYTYGGTQYSPIPGFTISGFAGTAAETYAAVNGFAFEPIVIPLPTGSCGPAISWSISYDGVLTLTGSGRMITYTSASEVPWLPYALGKDIFRINEVVISDGITSISPFAFSNCQYLTKISIPETVTKIGESAFENCRNLRAIDIPSDVTEIGASAFSGCQALTSVSIPQSVTVIPDRVFASCLSLSNVSYGSGITAIGSEAFSQTLLSVLEFPTVTDVDEGAFDGCTKLELISLPKVTELSASVFRGCSSLSHVEVGKLTVIGDSAFEGCSSLSSFTLSDSLTAIGNKGFYGCSALRSLRIPSSVMTLGEYAFSGASAITEITFRGSDSLILPAGVFENCSSLSEVNWGNRHITEIHEYAFAGCDAFTVIELPKGVRVIRDMAFGYYADTLVGGSEPVYEKYDKSSAPTFRAAIPSAIQNYAKKHGFTFESLGEIELDTGDLTPTVTWKIETAAKKLTIDGTGVIPDYEHFEDTPWYIYADYIEEVVFRNGVANVGAHSFHGCTSLKSVTFSADQEAIGIYAFAGTSLERFEGVNGLLEIREYAFDGCKKLTEVLLPSTVEQILDGAFRGNDLLTSVSIPDSVNHIGETSFGYSSSNKKNTAFIIKGTLDSMAYFHATQFGFRFLEEGIVEIKDPLSGASILTTDKLDDTYSLRYLAMELGLDSRYLFVGNEVIERYHLSLYRNEIDIAYSGQAEIRLPIPSSMGAEAKVFVLNEDGSFRSVSATVTGDSLIFSGTLGDFFLSSVDLSSMKTLTVEHRYEDNSLLSTPKTFLAIPGASYYFEATVPSGHTTEQGILQGTMPENDLTLTFLYTKIVITDPPATTAPPVTTPVGTETDPISDDKSDGGLLYILLIVVLFAILFAVVALILLNGRKKRQAKPITRAPKKASDKFAHTMIIPDAPTQELNVHSLFSEEPEEDTEATRKQGRRKSHATKKRRPPKK